MRKICDGCIHDRVCRKWEKGIKELTGLIPSNVEKPCLSFSPIPAPRKAKAVRMPKFTRFEPAVSASGRAGIVHKENGMCYSCDEVDAWIRRFMARGKHDRH
jgi:hypothetical protein